MRIKRRSTVLKSVLSRDQCINKNLDNDNDNNREVHLSRPDEDDEVYWLQYSADDEMKDDIYNEIEEVRVRDAY